MKNTFLIFIFMILTTMSCSAQGWYEVHLKSGEVLSAHRLRLVPVRSLGRAHVRLNDDLWRDRILIDSVDYIDGVDALNRAVFYKPLYIQGYLVWTTRLFHSERISIYHSRINHARKGTYNYYYYTKDDGRPTRLTMKDVSRDIGDDPKSKVYVKKARVAKGMSMTLTVVGGAMTAASMFTFATRDITHPVAADDRMPGLFVGGVWFLSMPFFLRVTWQKNLVEGLERYAGDNKEGGR